MVVLKNILVATDFSDASVAALTYGRDFARSYGATLHVLHVTESVLLRFSIEAPIAYLPELQTQIEEEARHRIDALVTDEDKTTLNARSVVLTSIGIPDAI